MPAFNERDLTCVKQFFLENSLTHINFIYKINSSMRTKCPICDFAGVVNVFQFVYLSVINQFIFFPILVTSDHVNDSEFPC